MLKRILKLDNLKVIAALSAITFIFLLFITVFYLVYIPVYAGNAPKQIVIAEGQGLRTIAGILKENRLIRSEWIFMIYVKLNNADDKLKAGRYNFAGRLDMPEITFILVNGLAESEDIRLLVSEGLNVWEIDQRLVKMNLIKEGDFSLEYYQEEGYLFPDTYRINRKSKSLNFSQELRQRMTDDFKNKTEPLLNGLTLEKQKEIIVVASILEKEAQTEQDMKLVSGIIYKRLEKGIPLQIDATVLYGACYRQFHFQVQELGSKIQDCDVTFQGVAREIKIDGPYNSYMRKGLPPGPISNPGLKAIDAAMNPTKSDYLYYLSTRDSSQMIFSKTPGEHAVNRRKYLGI